MRKRTTFQYITAGLLAVALAAGSTGCKRDNGLAQQFSFEGYPIRSSAKLTYWMELNGNLALSTDSVATTPFAKKLQEETGVNVEFLHPKQGMEKEEFNIMLASGDLPDIVQYNWYNIPGGPESAIAGGHIQPLNELIAEETPHLQAYLQAHPEIDKMVKTDEGHYYVFPFIRNDESLCIYEGPMLRSDWLSEVGLGVPETIGEWTQVLRTFRDKKSADVPFASGSIGLFAGAFGTQNGYYLENGKIQYGPMQPAFLEYLRTMKQWYDEGLIDKNIATTSGKEFDELIRSGNSGAFYGLLASDMGRMITDVQKIDPAFDLVAAPFPAEEKGKRPKFGSRDYAYTSKGSVAITAACKSPRLAARFLDYGYSAEGKTLYNYGIENESYVWDNGKMAYTDEILHNPQGLSAGEALSFYACSSYSGPFIQEKEHVGMFYTLPAQQEAVRLWADNDGEQYMVPRICATADESYEIGTIDDEVERYRKEMTMKFIMGVEPLENFEAFRQGLRERGIERALEIRQQQYQRYQNR